MRDESGELLSITLGALSKSLVKKANKKAFTSSPTFPNEATH
jgi:hypothetical protein